MSKAFDVLVIGAGPAGTTTALALARRGFKVAVLDRGTSAKRRVGETLPSVAAASLAALGLWQDFLQQGHRPAYALRSIWATEEPLERLAIHARRGPGFHLDRSGFDAWLMNHALASGVTLLAPAERWSLQREPRDAWRLSYSTANELNVATASFLVDASGSGGAVGRKLGARCQCVQRLVGLARFFSCSEVEPVTLVEATPEGYFYSVPVPGDAMVAVCITAARPGIARRDDALQAWNRHLLAAKATARRLASAETPGPVVVRSTGPMLTCGVDSESFLAVGDAACRLDPIAGEGLVFALRSALDAATVLEELAHGRTAARAHYWAGVSRVFRDHLAYRRRAYGAVQRFAELPFWVDARASS